MSTYNKLVWGTGDEITASKLNNLEDGVEGAALELESIKAGDIGVGKALKDSLGNTIKDTYETKDNASTARGALVPKTRKVNNKELSGDISLDKGDIGLSKVYNYGIATQTEAEDGTDNDEYMTPLRVAQAIAKQVGTATSGHTSDNDNPHSVTKAQVGLGSVPNYGISNDTDAIDGLVNNKLMTPLRVKEAIAAQTPAKASTQDAEGRDNDTKYMTPEKTKALLDADSYHDSTFSGSSWLSYESFHLVRIGKVVIMSFAGVGNIYNDPNGALAGVVCTSANAPSSNVKLYGTYQNGLGDTVTACVGILRTNGGWELTSSDYPPETLFTVNAVWEI